MLITKYVLYIRNLFLVSCDHHRAHEYFVEAILNPKEFAARKCGNWDSYKKDKCESEEVAMGNLTTKATGKFFLETNKDRPFARARSKESSFTDSLLNIFRQ